MPSLFYSECQVTRTEFTDSFGRKSYPSNTHKTSVGIDDHTVSQTYGWGKVVYQFQLAGTVIDVAIKITNKTAKTMTGMIMDLTRMNFPSKPTEFDGSTPLVTHNIDLPTAISMSYSSGVTAFVNKDVENPLLSGFPFTLNPPASTVFPVQIVIGRHPMYPTSFPFIDRPIAPRSDLALNMAFRFGSPGATLSTLADDIYKDFARAFPYKTTFADRRSIGQLVISSAGVGGTNPRGWFNDPTVNVTTLNGIEAFKARLLSWADGAVSIMQSMGSQGMITWDIEGQENPHPVSYIGDPRIAESLAPEMVGVVDQYFAKFTNAGFRTGVTLRPQQFVSGTQQEVNDSAQLLINKIAYAKNRWGCTLFYVDSNFDTKLNVSGSLINADVFETALAAHPDVLLMPEHETTRYYAYTTPYNELRAPHNFASTPVGATSVYPQAFNLINTSDGDIDGRHDDLLASVRAGSILMYRAWFNDPGNAKVKAIYDEA